MAIKYNKILIIKSIIYRPYSEFITFFIAWAVTGHLKLSATIGIVDFLFKVVSYFAFDLFWNKFVIGKYKPCVVWMTGLSGAGKSSIADNLCEKLKKKGIKCIIIDGDEIRNAFPNIGFDKEARIKHNINVGYMASLLEKQGYIVIVSLISPFSEARDKCRIITNKFIETYISTPLDVCEKRDVKGLYAKARAGKIKQFTGIDDPYEVPVNPELSIDTSENTINECVNKILNQIKK